MRQKPKIKVLFVISEISIWKTESLYCEMLKHPRFEPILGIALIAADKPSESIRKFSALLDYISQKKYSYVELYGNDINKEIKPDIIFYQQPYDDVIDRNLFYKNNRESLFCNVNYAFNSIGQKWVGSSEYLHYCWQTYYDNSVAKDYYESVTYYKE